ncbi:MAG TPA: glycoside hydrolase family 20 zincin-like fold domain-containing protein [Thermoanaerobaculia bacterium]|nr:glycoside hydrolase family 20 zincin-like fold domain-containing protein [Thermoanaerobaculia bacterium]
MAAPPLDLLWPRPQRVRLTGETLRLTAPSLVAEAPETAVRPVRRQLQRVLSESGLALASQGGAAGAPSLRLALATGLRPQGYRLEIGRQGAVLGGADPAGLFYAACTFAQWLRLAGERLDGGLAVPGIVIEDWPDLLQRGFLLDVSRDKVPTMDTLLALVELLASLKGNQLQLYIEHTFAYRGHEEVWRGADPLTPRQMRELDDFCRQRHVELVPNQNSFGHFHRWLCHPRYRPLAEVPEGIAHPFATRVEPFSLCPVDPRVPELLADLYDQLLPNFTSGLFNVGLDETFDLCQGRSAAACAERGKGRVYLDFLQQVQRLVAERGRRMQFWGDVILEHPDLIPELPRQAVAMEWGYEAEHPFGERLAHFAASGLEFVVCPGTSGWNSFAGRCRNAVANLAAAARAAQRARAAGVLVTDWGDNGHLQPLPVSWPGLVAGSGFAWNAATVEAADGLPLAPLVDQHVLAGQAAGVVDALLRLGDAYLHTGTRNFNGSALFFLLVFPQDDLGHPRYRGLSAAGLERVREEVAAAVAALPAGGSGEAALVGRELRWVAELLAVAAELGQARLAAGPTVPLGDLPAGERRRLGGRLEEAIAEHAPVWLARNRPGGRQDSVARLERPLQLLREG